MNQNELAVLDEPLDVVDGRFRHVITEARVVRLGCVEELLTDSFRAEAPAAMPAATVDWPNTDGPMSSNG